MSGADILSLPPGKHRLPCPQCSRGKRDDALGVTVDDEGAVFHCFRCGWKGSSRNGASDPKPRRHRTPAKPDKLPKIAALAKRSVPASRSIARRYLESRGLELPDDTPLLFCPDAWHWPTETRLPCMVAPIVDVRTNELQAAHQTFLRDDGRGKANVEKPRLYFGPKAGGCVKLSPDEDVTYGLAIGEGIESSLTAIMGGHRAWACLDRGNIEAFPVLDGIETLNIIADNDPDGMRSANRAAARWRAAGKEARLIPPARDGDDWNDRLTEARHG